MPRAAWLATGAAIAALGAAAGGVAALALLGGASVIASIGAAVRRRAWPIALGAGVVAVCLRLGVAAATMPDAEVPSLPDGTGPWTGTVVSLSAPAADAQRAVIEISGVGHAASWKVACRLPLYPEVIPGDAVVVEGRLQPPGTDSYGDYLRRAGIAGSLTSYQLDLSGPGSGPLAWLEQRRRDAGELLAVTLPAPQGGLAAGIVVGLRDRVDRDLAAAFTTAGLSHIVAISGWNIAIVAGVVGSLLRGLARRRRAAVTLAIIGAYCIAAGGGPSVVRAALMAGAVILVRETGRRARAAEALGLAAFTLLLVDPSVVLDAGFQLSAVATAGLLAWGDRLSAWLRRRLPTPTPGWLVESFGVSLAAQAATLPIVILDFGRISLVAPVANLVAAPLVTPVMAASAAALAAGWVTTLGVPAAMQAAVGGAASLVIGMLVAVVRAAASLPGASLTVEPPASWVVAATIAALVAGAATGVPGRLGGRLRVRSRLQGWACRLDLAGRRLAASRSRRVLAAPRSSRDGRLASPNHRVMHRIAASIRRATGPSSRMSRRGTHASGRVRRLARLGAAPVLAGFAAVVLLAGSAPDSRLRVSVLDVGQGDAILLAGPAGSRLLVDAGPDPDALLERLDERIPAWDRRIDVVVLTHPHDDHVGGMALLLRRYRIGQVIENGMEGTGPAARACEEALEATGVRRGVLAAGDQLVFDSVRVLVRWPEPGTVPRAPPADGSGVNDASIVLDVRYGERRVLLTGDVEEGVDPQLLDRGIAGPGEPPVDLLKVAHHGSRTSSTAALLAALRPRLAVVSVGTGNRYGHPAAATLARLQAAGARTWRTDRDGTVTISTDGHDLRVEVQGQAWTAAVDRQPDRGGPAAGTPATSGVPRIGAWPFPPVAPPPRSSSPWTHRPGTWRMSASSPRSRPTSRNERRLAASRSIVPLSRPPPSSTMSTSCSRPVTRSRSSGTGTPGLAG